MGIPAQDATAWGREKTQKLPRSADGKRWALSCWPMKAGDDDDDDDADDDERCAGF